MDEAVEVFLSRDSIRHGLCAENIGHIKYLVVEDRARDVALGGKMDYDVRAAHKLAYEVVIRYVAVPKFESFRRLYVVGDIVGRASVGQRIEYQEMVVGIFPKKVFEKIAPDKSRATGN